MVIVACQKWRANNALAIAEYNEKNRERILKANREWAAKRLIEKRDEINAKKRERYLINLEAERQRASAWSKANPEKRRLWEQNRRAKKRENGSGLSKGIIEKLLTLQKGRCPCCGLALGSGYELDHKMPIALGGAHEDWNMQLLRKECNRSKKAKHPIEYMQSKGFLL
jgi:5-methylcytosine-specific restriction endonuclease McrA